MPQTLPFKSTLDDSQFDAAMRRMEARGIAVASKIGGGLKNLASPILAIGPAVAAAFTGRAIASGVGQIFDAGRALRMLSRETGASVSGLVILQSKFKQAGLDGDMVGSSIAKLQKSIAGVENDENKGGPAALEKLGLNLAALGRMAPDQQFLAVGAAISKIANPAERSATAMKIFGRAGYELGALFNKPGFAEIAPGLQQKADMMARNAATFERISIKLERVGNVIKTFYAGVADKFASALEPILNRLESVNLVSIGQQFGEALARGAVALGPMLDKLEKIDWKGIASTVGTMVVALAASIPDLMAKLSAMFKDDANIVAAIQKALGGSGENDKDKQIATLREKVAGDERAVNAAEADLKNPFVANDPKRRANREEWLRQTRLQLRQDADSLSVLTGDAPVGGRSGTSMFHDALPTDSEHFKRPFVIGGKDLDWGQVYDETAGGALDVGATESGLSGGKDHPFNGSAPWASVQGGLGLNASYGATGGGTGGSIWTQISGRVEKKDPVEKIAGHAQKIEEHTSALRDVWTGGGSSGGSNGGATATR